jgi:hypothetical protein
LKPNKRLGNFLLAATRSAKSSINFGQCPS